MWDLNHEKAWAEKNCRFCIVVLKTIESPLNCKIKSVNSKGNQPWIFFGRTDAEALIFGCLIWRADSLEKTLMLGKNESKRRRGWQRMRRLDSITYSMDMNLSKLWERLEDRGAWHASVHGVTKSQTWLSDCRAAAIFGNTFQRGGV